MIPTGRAHTIGSSDTVTCESTETQDDEEQEVEDELPDIVEDGSSAIVATGGYDHTVKLWQAHSGLCYWTGQHTDSQVNALAIKPDKRLLAAAGYQHIRLYDLNNAANSSPVINFDGVNKNVTCVGFERNCKWMFTTGEDCFARIWDLRSSKMQCHRLFNTDGVPLNWAALHPNQREMFLADENGVIHQWNLYNDKNEQLQPEADASAHCVAVSSNGRFLAAVNNKGHCHIWNLSASSTMPNGCTQLTPKHKILAHSRHAIKCFFSPDSTLLVTTSADQSARIWNTEDFSLYRELTATGTTPLPQIVVDEPDELASSAPQVAPSCAMRWVWDARFTNDSQYLITASSDGVGRVWKIKTGKIERQLIGHQKAITALAFSDDSSVDS